MEQYSNQIVTTQRTNRNGNSEEVDPYMFWRRVIDSWWSAGIQAHGFRPTIQQCKAGGVGKLRLTSNGNRSSVTRGTPFFPF